MPGSIMSAFFLKLDGIVGESTDAKHKGEIELVSFSWGLTRSSSRGPGGGAGKAQFKEVDFLMRVNKASPDVFLAAASGKHLKDATLSISRIGKAAFGWVKIKFSDVFITSWEQVGEEEEAEYEVVAFDFAKVELQLTPQTGRGTAAA